MYIKIRKQIINFDNVGYFYPERNMIILHFAGHNESGLRLPLVFDSNEEAQSAFDALTTLLSATELPGAPAPRSPRR